MRHHDPDNLCGTDTPIGVGCVRPVNHLLGRTNNLSNLTPLLKHCYKEIGRTEIAGQKLVVRRERTKHPCPTSTCERTELCVASEASGA
jgi:hypothetical protein